MSPLDPLNEIGYMPTPSNLEDQIQLTPTIFGAPKNPLTYSHSSCQGVLPIQFYNSRPPYTLCLCIRYRPFSFLVLSNYNTYIVK